MLTWAATDPVWYGCVLSSHGDEPTGDWATSHDSVHNVLMNKKSNAMLFSTEENLVSFLCCCFTKVLPFHRVQGCSTCTCPWYLCGQWAVGSGQWASPSDLYGTEDAPPSTSLPVMDEIDGVNTTSLGEYLHSTKTRAKRAEGFHDELNGHVFNLKRVGLGQVVLCP